MNTKLWILVLIMNISTLQAQKIRDNGMLSLGVRSTASFFDEGGIANNGIGAGGQFRIQLNRRINTEWFADYIKTSVGSKVYRNTAHIGWSVFYYPYVKSEEKQFLKPYVLAGHCFDYAKYIVRNTTNPSESHRFTSAVQAGIGTHFNLTNRFDISLSTQYMIHLGKHIHVHEEEDGTVEFEENASGLNLQGHLLTTISINYKIANLWKGKS